MINRILIECPAELQAAYNAPDSDFEEINSINYLKLLTDRSHYKPTKNYNNGAPRYIRTFSSTIAQIKAYTLEIEIAVTDERSHIYYILDDIRKLASANLQSQTPIKLLDFVLPESNDLKSAIASNTPPFTLRQGMLCDITPNGGTVSYGGQSWISGGCTLKFEDLIMRT